MSRALRGDLNRVLNAESANLQRAVGAAGRQLDAIADARADGRLAEQPDIVRLVAEARRETPEATLSDLAERLALHRSAVQRALERIERLALARRREDAGRPRGRGRTRSAVGSGMIRADASRRRRRQLEDAHDPGRCRRTGTDDRVPDARGGRHPGHLPAVRVPCGRPDALAEADPDVAVGAQNVHHELAGAYTGEIAAPMLDGLATWVIVGHSERRRDAGETDELIGRKLGRAVDAGLRPILCVGEQLADREAGRAD